MTLFNKDTFIQQTGTDYLKQQLGWEAIYAYNNENFEPDSLMRLMNQEDAA